MKWLSTFSGGCLNRTAYPSPPGPLDIDGTNGFLYSALWKFGQDMAKRSSMKKLTTEYYGILKGYFERQTYRVSSYSLPSMIAWSNACYNAGYTIIDGMFFAEASLLGRPGNRHLTMPISAFGPPSPALLCELVSQLDCREICFVPGDYLESAGRSNVEKFFDIAEQPEYEDYIYLTRDLAELRGNRYAKKRNLIHQFTRDYVAKKRVETGRITNATAPECLDFLEKWCALRDCDAEQKENMACEKEAVIQALLTIEQMDWQGLWVRLDGEISAFAIMSHLTPEMGVLNFEKAYPSIRGLYQFLDNECARQLFQGYMYMNKESDMGIPALADSKKSYYPVEKIKSYCLKIRD